ncbi:hypothetical protein DVH24_009247 [Malus domestica]|uniref:TATA-box-binding protein n=1 Tax=Malus domestica TaxID=3750 RepID=A0A498IPD1_MALDO|nr:hypothetical protein DVH24_009247 [Malus domestica]
MEAQGLNQYQVNKTKGMAEEGSHPVVVDLSKHPSGIVPTLQNIVSTVNLDCKLDLKAIALKARNSEYNPKACDVSSIASPAIFLLHSFTFLLFKSYNIFYTMDPFCGSLCLTIIFILHTNSVVSLQRFAAVIMRIREPKTTALIFASGKMVCTGAKSEEQSRLAARKYARVIQKLGFPAKFKVLSRSLSNTHMLYADFKIQNIVGSCDVKFSIRLEALVVSHCAFSSYEPEIFPGLIYRMKQPKIVLLIFVSGKIVLTGAKARTETYEAFENIYPVLTGFRKNQHWYEV